MNVATITMPKAEARRQLAACRKALHRKADAEYQALEAGYRELALGRPLVDVAAIFRTVEVNAKGWPKLAIARADRKQVRVTARQRQLIFNTAFLQRGGRIAHGAVFTFRPEAPLPQWGDHGYALVPIVPPQAKAHHDLSYCFVLWEVEQWAASPIGATPDVDPYLLRWIHGDLYAVLAEWDLTPLEQAVMSGRRGE